MEPKLLDMPLDSIVKPGPKLLDMPLDPEPREAGQTGLHGDFQPVQGDHLPGKHEELNHDSIVKTMVKPSRPLTNDDGSMEKMEELDYDLIVQQALLECGVLESDGSFKDLCLVEDDFDPDALIAQVAETVRLRVAIDSGATANVAHPQSLPANVHVVPYTGNQHFRGANNSRIERYGHAETVLENANGKVGCGWELCDVGRALHSVSTVCGPEDHPTGKQDVLFNNKLGVVVPPGVVAAILRRIKPVAHYPRDGNLYVGEFDMSSFPRQGLAA